MLSVAQGKTIAWIATYAQRPHAEVIKADCALVALDTTDVKTPFCLIMPDGSYCTVKLGEMHAFSG